jgi:hypothetical protein
LKFGQVAVAEQAILVVTVAHSLLAEQVVIMQLKL